LQDGHSVIFLTISITSVHIITQVIINVNIVIKNIYYYIRKVAINLTTSYKTLLLYLMLIALTGKIMLHPTAFAKG